MAFNVVFKLIGNQKELQRKGIPWLCDKCHCENEVLLKITIDYNVVVLCKKCLMEAKRLITDMEKVMNESRNNKKPS